YQFWCSLSFDPIIRNSVQGLEIEFDKEVIQYEIPEPYKFPIWKQRKINEKLNEMISKGIIEPTEWEEDCYVSNIFTKTKSDLSFRIILDLSDLNEAVKYHHFKMDCLNTAIDLMSENCYMTSIDWKDAYYSVPVNIEFRKYLTFQWNENFFRYTCLPNGLGSGPRQFCKLTKVLFSDLRREGVTCTSYIDDCLIIGDTVNECKESTKKLVEISQNAGFVTHPIKSVLEPTQEIIYLGFHLNSVNMTVRLTAKKAGKIKDACAKILQLENCTIQFLAKVVGMLVASLPGVQYGQLFYRSADLHKSKALALSKGVFSGKTVLPHICRNDLQWWIDNIENEKKLINLPEAEILLQSDACNTGWGGCKLINNSKEKTGGNWEKSEREHHINYLELLAAWLTIQSFCKNEKQTKTHKNPSRQYLYSSVFEPHGRYERTL
ncbi:MAG: hypothetical protein GY705_23615, partial [Bacteroidetes bacterium]|nr:hypothetical protein [Bacteroidota bacterium]